MEWFVRLTIETANCGIDDRKKYYIFMQTVSAQSMKGTQNNKRIKTRLGEM
jgi:hypothetical protein